MILQPIPLIRYFIILTLPGKVVGGWPAAHQNLLLLMVCQPQPSPLCGQSTSGLGWKKTSHGTHEAPFVTPVPVFLLLPALHPSLPEGQPGQRLSLLAAGSPHEWVKAATQKLSKAQLCSPARRIKKPKEKANLSFKAREAQP